MKKGIISRVSKSSVVPKYSNSEFDASPKKPFKFSSDKVKLNQIDFDFDDLEDNFQKAFEELSVKSEILGILSNNKFDIRSSNCSSTTTAFSAKISDDVSGELNFEDERVSLPPIRSKNPISHKSCEGSEDELQNLHIIRFSSSLKN